MNVEETEKNYRAMGLTVKQFNDAPGHVYRFHRHAETRLFGISGVGFLKLGEGDDSTYQTVLPGQEIIVHNDELHGGVAGPEGWTYLGARGDDSILD